VNDERSDRVEPDLRVAYTHADFLAGRDPLVEAVLRFELPPGESFAVEPAQLDRFAGRYLFSPHQILTVTRVAERLHLNVDDFIEASCANAESDLHAVSPTRFRADIPGVELRFTDGGGGGGTVTVSWGESRTTAPRAAADFRLPLELVREGRVEEGVAAFVRDTEYARSVPGLEADLNRFGYRMLRDERYAHAIRIFRLNVELFPASANTYDSLGEAYLQSGEFVRARSNYERSLQLDPDNDNAREMLRWIAQDEDI